MKRKKGGICLRRDSNLGLPDGGARHNHWTRTQPMLNNKYYDIIKQKILWYNNVSACVGPKHPKPSRLVLNNI